MWPCTTPIRVVDDARERAANPRTWPAGLYHVEVFLDGVSVGRKDFTIQ